MEMEFVISSTLIRQVMMMVTELSIQKMIIQITQRDGLIVMMVNMAGWLVSMPQLAILQKVAH